jgi:tetratricopeptide (TPR) repeat protein
MDTIRLLSSGRIACLLIILLAAGIQHAKERDRDWLEKLNKMESQANDARRAYWRGRYDDAQRQFTELAGSVHPSTILYLNESAMCNLAQGNYPAAEQQLRQVDSLLNTYQSVEREKRAVSVFGAEAEKVYRGDPYEQASAYMLLALILMDRGDYDNALAACKSGILADSDASENLFDSDIALLHALEAKCCLLRGDKEAFSSRRDAAAKGVRLTSMQVRDDFSKRQDLLELLKMSSSERRRLGDKRKDDEIRAEIQSLTARLDKQIESIDAAALLGPLYSGDYNVLILVPRGRCAKKVRTGTDAEMILFQEHTASSQFPELSLDGQSMNPDGVLSSTVDVDFQATTRGGRRMDAILRGKAASRATTRGLGESLTQAGNNVGGVGGLGVALVGAIVQGTAGAMTPEADTRCWQSLPKYFQIYALKLPYGQHELRGAHYVYFEKKTEFRHEFSLVNETDMATVIVPPPLYGAYFCAGESKLSERDREGFGRTSTILLPPPTGLDDVVRIRVSGKDEKPEALAPDPKRMMRSIQEALKAHTYVSSLVWHEETIQSRAFLADNHRRALQCDVGEIVREGTRKSGMYRTTFTFSLIEAKTGKTLLSRSVEGTCTDVAAGPSTAFYKCVRQAADAFLNSPDFTSICGPGST